MPYQNLTPEGADSKEKADTNEKFNTDSKQIDKNLLGDLKGIPSNMSISSNS
jgi:hypothetical protein